MPINKIKLKQIDADFSGLVGEYGSGYFATKSDLSILSGDSVKNSSLDQYNFLYTTGSQDISGAKNFKNTTTINGQAISTLDKTVNITGQQSISGEKTFNGSTNFYGNIYSQGNSNVLNNSSSSYINSNFNFDNVSITNLSNSLSSNFILNTGYQDISGIKNFYSRPQFSGSGLVVSGEPIQYANQLTNPVKINNVLFSGLSDIEINSYVYNDNSTGENRFLVFSAGSSSGYKNLYRDSALIYNALSNSIRATIFSGNLSGNALTASRLSGSGKINGEIFDGSKDINIDLTGVSIKNSNIIGNTGFLIFVSGQGLESKELFKNLSLYFDIQNDNLVSPKFSGDISGNALTASRLRSGISINGVPFNGASSINIPIKDIKINSETTSQERYILYTSGTSVLSNKELYQANSLKYIENSNTLVADLFSGNLSGTSKDTLKLKNAVGINGILFDGSSSITVPISNLDISTTLNTGEAYLLFTSGSSAGEKNIFQGTSTTSVIYNPFSRSLKADVFSGNLSGISSSANKLTTGRTINGVQFDGTANISINSNLNQLNRGSANNGDIITWDSSISSWVPSGFSFKVDDIGGITSGGKSLLTGSLSERRNALSLGTAAYESATSFSLTGHTHTSSAISDSTQIGRNLLTATTTGAQRSFLGLGTSAIVDSGQFARNSHTHSISDLTSGIALAGEYLVFDNTSAQWKSKPLAVPVDAINGITSDGKVLITGSQSEISGVFGFGTMVTKNANDYSLTGHQHELTDLSTGNARSGNAIIFDGSGWRPTGLNRVALIDDTTSAARYLIFCSGGVAGTTPTGSTRSLMQFSGLSYNPSTQILRSVSFSGSNIYGSSGLSLTTIGSGNTIGFGFSGAQVYTMSSGNFRSEFSGRHALGTPALTWSDIYLTNAPTVISDKNLKTEISDIPDSWLDAWSEINYAKFKFKSSVDSKGSDQARWHIGLIAQDIHESFNKRSLNAFDIGLLGRTIWEHSSDEIGNIESGEIWYIRPDECQFMEMALMRRSLNKLNSIVSGII